MIWIEVFFRLMVPARATLEVFDLDGIPAFTQLPLQWRYQ
jgi:hypothetical protein